MRIDGENERGLMERREHAKTDREWKTDEEEQRREERLTEKREME